MTLAEENYLKAIFHIESETKKGASTSAISKQLQTKAASVSDMLRKLSDKNYIAYEKYYGATLTDKGRHEAVMIVRRHRLWETFLVDKLHFGWDEVHDVAEDLEHIKNDKLINALDAYLDYPKLDPHGDAIPNAKGEVISAEKKLLSLCTEGEEGTIIGVKDSSPEFLQLLDKRNIAIGLRFKIVNYEPFDGSLTLSFESKTLMLSEKLAENIFVLVSN